MTLDVFFSKNDQFLFLQMNLITIPFRLSFGIHIIGIYILKITFLIRYVLTNKYVDTVTLVIPALGKGEAGLLQV